MVKFPKEINSVLSCHVHLTAGSSPLLSAASVRVKFSHVSEESVPQTWLLQAVPTKLYRRDTGSQASVAVLLLELLDLCYESAFGLHRKLLTHTH